MGKKRGRQPDIEDILARPWCYYCERDFEDLKLLISHQKAKHFKCDKCGRRLNTAGGLSVHLNQVHKETLEHVENALPNRQALDVEIFGMEGMPLEVLETHRNRLINTFYTAQEERKKATGNPLPGQVLVSKRGKIVIESRDALKARVRAWRVRQKNDGGMEGVVQTGYQQYPPQGYSQQEFGGLPARPGGGDDIDNLIRMAEAGIKPTSAAQPSAPLQAPPVAAPEGKKKEKGGRMFYEDAEVSPEERMAALANYAFRGFVV